MAYHVSKQHFSDLVELALHSLPESFAKFLEEVPVEIRDRSPDEFRQRLGMGPGSLLLGLYHGRPLTQRSVEHSGALPDVIYIFQHDIELATNSEDNLVEQVRKTVLHEVGHLFGLDESDLRRLGYG